MLRHIVVFIYIFGSFLGMTGMILYWLMSKKKTLKDEAQCVHLQKFMVSTFLIGLISFFTFYSQYIIFLQPTNTAYRILDYLFWVCFMFYWIDYLDSMVDGDYLRKIKVVVKYGCLGYIVIWIFSTAHIWDEDFVIINHSGKLLFLLLDVLFCLLSLLVVVIYVARGQRQVKSKLSGFYIFSVSAALMVYAAWEFVHYIRLFTGLAMLRTWELDPFNATAFFLFFTNLISLVYVYYNDFSAIFLKDQEDRRNVAAMYWNHAEGKNCVACAAAAVSTAGVPAMYSFESGVLTANSAGADVPAGNSIEADAPAGNSDAESATTKDLASEHNLTPREKEVMEFVCKGFNNAEIADQLYISQNTVKHHVYNLFRKLDVSNRVELICLLQDYNS